MKVTGIIAEYNPFHKGHQYQLKQLRSRYQPDYVVIAMSGDFLQRGTPALIHKYERARMALMQGADLVFELPVCFSTASAETFARGGILLFDTTGVVDSVCFGAESDDLNGLTSLAKLLVQEPDSYRDSLLSYLKEGLSYPAARMKALPEYANLLDSPNNILATEYLKSMLQFLPDAQPILIPRAGSGYHNPDISAPIASATAIRSRLFQTIDALEAEAALADALPETSLQILQAQNREAAFLCENDFSLLLHHALLLEDHTSLLSYADMSPALANRLMQYRNQFLSWSDFCKTCDTKDMTFSRISRVLTHILLKIKEEALLPYTGKEKTTLPYLRILGFRKDAAPLLRVLKQAAKAPLITSVADSENQLSKAGLSMLSRDLFASDLYRSVLTAKTGQIYPNEYHRRFLVL